MSAALPLFLIRPDRPPRAYAVLDHLHKVVADQSWVLLRYAEVLLRELKVRGCLPDKFFLNVQRSSAPEQPPRPSITAAAPKGPAKAASPAGGKIAAAAKAIICGWHGDDDFPVPHLGADTPASNSKFWKSEPG